MEASAFVSAVCMSAVGALCLVGVFHSRYDDTLGERVGMSLVGVWCLARLPVKLFGGEPTEPVHLILHVGLASFAVGMAVAKYRARHCDCPQGDAGTRAADRGHASQH